MSGCVSNLADIRARVREAAFVRAVGADYTGRVRTLCSALVVASIGACACGSGDRDAGSDVPALAYDAPLAVPSDAPSPDVPLRAPLCGVVDATACPVQDAADVDGCASGAVGVFFDGTTCRAADAAVCGAEAPAFDSFSECAVACEAAGHCDASKFYRLPSREPIGCRTGPTPPPPGLFCNGGGLTVLSTVPLPTTCDIYASHPVCDASADRALFRCARATHPYSVVDELVFARQMSLLPFIVGVECAEPGD